MVSDNAVTAGGIDKRDMRTLRIACIVVAMILPALVSVAQPKVSNRAPKPDEVGYRPADGATVATNPPSLVWLHEPQAAWNSTWATLKAIGVGILLEFAAGFVAFGIWIAGAALT